MRTKTVKRHWCDHCNKAGLQARSMLLHEKRCTLNPARECRVCRLIEDGMDSDEFEAKRPLAEIVSMLPDPTAYLNSFCGQQLDYTHGDLTRAINAAMPSFRAAAGNCPACMMAALRQRKIPVPMVEDFDFKSEMTTIFANRKDDSDYDY